MARQISDTSTDHDADEDNVTQNTAETIAHDATTIIIDSGSHEIPFKYGAQVPFNEKFDNLKTGDIQQAQQKKDNDTGKGNTP